MNRATLTFAAIAVLYGVSVSAQSVGNETVCFVPGPVDCASVAVAEIDKAKTSIMVQAYNLTEPHIADALIAAKSRGVNVWLIVDKTAPRERGGVTERIAAAGIPTSVDYEPHIAHNKVMVIDVGTPSAEVLTGSLNWSVAAVTANAENLLVVHDPSLTSLYGDNFKSRLNLSEPLQVYDARHPAKQHG